MLPKKTKAQRAARRALFNRGWEYYPSGGGVVVWAKITTAGRVYLGPDEGRNGGDVDIEEMVMGTPVEISISDRNFDCVISSMRFASLKDFLRTDMLMDGRPIDISHAEGSKSVYVYREY